jgi:hypothetical protein
VIPGSTAVNLLTLALQGRVSVLLQAIVQEDQQDLKLVIHPHTHASWLQENVQQIQIARNGRHATCRQEHVLQSQDTAIQTAIVLQVKDVIPLYIAAIICTV